MQANEPQSGNALFLILIAVVLFAALSYAITQSNRSSGNVGRETNTISGTTIMQYATGVQTGIQRLLLRGVTPNEVLFNDPANYSINTTREVFHPDGGGVAYQEADPNVVETGGQWHYLIDKPVEHIGTSANTVVLVLSNVKKGICEQINQQFEGNATIQTQGTPLNSFQSDGAGTTIKSNGRPSGCMKLDDGYAYFQVMVEQ